MTSMSTQSDAEWWAEFNAADQKASRRRHPAGRARTPMDTATHFREELAEIDAQTGRVLPRRIDPPARMLEAPAPPTPVSEYVTWAVFTVFAVAAIAWVGLAVFYGWDGPVW